MAKSSDKGGGNREKPPGTGGRPPNKGQRATESGSGKPPKSDKK